MSYTIFHQLVVKSNISDVFNAVSLPKELENWWPLKCSGHPNLIETYNFNFTDEYDWYAKVSSVKQNEHIHYKLTKSDTDWNPTSFGFDLKETDNGILIDFWHKDWEKPNDHFRHSSFCWAMLLNGLKNYLEKQIIIPFEKRS